MEYCFLTTTTIVYTPDTMAHVLLLFLAFPMAVNSIAPKIKYSRSMFAEEFSFTSFLYIPHRPLHNTNQRVLDLLLPRSMRFAK